MIGNFLFGDLCVQQQTGFDVAVNFNGREGAGSDWSCTKSKKNTTECIAMLEFDFTFFTFATGGCKKKHSHTNTTLCSPRVDQERGKHAHSNSGDIKKMSCSIFFCSQERNHLKAYLPNKISICINVVEVAIQKVRNSQKLNTFLKICWNTLYCAINLSLYCV